MNANNPNPATGAAANASGKTGSGTPPPPPTAPQVEIDAINARLKTIEQTLEKATLDDSNKKVITDNLQAVRDEADRFVIQYSGTDVSSFRAEADKLEAMFASKTNAPAGGGANPAPGSGSGNQPQTGGTASSGNQPSAGGTTGTGSQPSTGGAPAAQAQPVTGAPATSLANVFVRHWKVLVIIGLILLTIGCVIWWIVNRTETSSDNTANNSDAVALLQTQLATVIQDLTNSQAQIRELIARKTSTNQSDGSQSNDRKSQEPGIHNQMKNVKDNHGFINNGQINLWSNSVAAVLDMVNALDMAGSGIQTGSSNLVVVTVPPDKIEADSTFYTSLNVHPNDCILIIPPQGGWRATWWISLPVDQFVVLNDDQQGHPSPGRSHRPEDSTTVRAGTTIWLKPGVPGARLEVTIKKL